MNTRKILMEIRISPARQERKHKFVHDIRMEAFREIVMRQSENPSMIPSTPSRFWEILQVDRKTL